MSYNPYRSRRNRSAAMLANALAGAVSDAPRAKRTRLFDSSDYCEWFALCENRAVRLREHPILGQVPICHRCDEKVEALS